MKQGARRNTLMLLVSFVSGGLFALGLAVAGMTQPSKVIGFLDVAGDWDPSLAFVMLGAIPVYFVASRRMQRLHGPLVASTFQLPARRDLDPKLVIGAALFGVGWGLAGYCPGPALTSLGAGAPEAVVFVLAMAVGTRLFEATQRLRARRATPGARPPDAGLAHASRDAP